MNKPLLITDCDEVLLHMVSHFGAWLEEDHAITFSPNGEDFSDALSYRDTGALVPREQVWPLLDGFFTTEMHRQTLIPHARESLATLADRADIVVLTNLTDEFNAARVAQLLGHDIPYRVITNQGGKGKPVKRLMEEYQPSAAVFIDDLAHHHSSVAEHAPEVFRIHMVGEPSLAPNVPKAEHAHVRIDCWSQAHYWIKDRFDGIDL